LTETTVMTAQEPVTATALANDPVNGTDVVLVVAGNTRIRLIQRDASDPRGPIAAEFFSREVDVLRLLAEGMDTMEIAGRLSYSERTVRNIIHGVLTRLKLRNRVHAVAYAFRSGVI
jgi:DNA-binding NarL/FixJ family response regulator